MNFFISTSVKNIFAEKKYFIILFASISISILYIKKIACLSCVCVWVLARERVCVYVQVFSLSFKKCNKLYEYIYTYFFIIPIIPLNNF